MLRRQDNPLECGPISSASMRARNHLRVNRWTAIIVPLLPRVASPHDGRMPIGRRNANCPFRRQYGDDLSLAAKQSVFACLRVITLQRSGRLRLSHTTSPRSSTRPVRDRQHDLSEVVCMTGPTSSTRR